MIEDMLSMYDSLDQDKTTLIIRKGEDGKLGATFKHKGEVEEK